MPDSCPRGRSRRADLRTEHDDQATTELSRQLAARLQFP